MKYILCILLSILCLYSYSGELSDYAPDDGKILKKEYYILSFNDKALVPEWTVYSIEEPIKSLFNRKGLDFKRDKDCPLSVPDSSYRGSGYDAGHFVPAEDMSFSQEAIKSTFLTSNCAPQLPEFNRGIWKILETRIRKWADSGHKMVIVTGGIYGREKINQMGIATHFYKVVYFIDEGLIICFLLNHERLDQDLNKYIVSIDEFESVSGKKVRIPIKK